MTIQVTLRDSKLQHSTTSRIESKALMSTLQMAVALDPRYKRLTFIRRSKREAIWTTLPTAFRAFYDRKHRAGRPTEEVSNSEIRSPVPKRRKLTLLLSDSESQSSANESDAVRSAESELMRYHEEAPIPETEDPLMWWKLNNYRFPVLGSFVQTILCVPATSDPKDCSVLQGLSSIKCDHVCYQEM